MKLKPVIEKMLLKAGFRMIRIFTVKRPTSFMTVIEYQKIKNEVASDDGI
tara:strand:- start:12164 stop:12313 length:150 start_codon:yes stop_codon:yes gene_type:complete